MLPLDSKTPQLGVVTMVGVRTSVGGFELGSLNVEAITLREKKMGDGIPEPCKEWSFMNM